MLNDTIGQIHFWITFIGTYAIYFPMHFLAIPRRYYEYNVGESAILTPSMDILNQSITITAYIVGIAQFLFIYNLIVSYRHGREAGDNPWEANSLEWRTPQTPPVHGNWGERLPTVHRWAYDFSVPGEEKDFIPQDVPREARA